MRIILTLEEMFCTVSVKKNQDRTPKSTDGNKRVIENEDKDFYLFVQPKGKSGWWAYQGNWKLVDIDSIQYHIGGSVYCS